MNCVKWRTQTGFLNVVLCMKLFGGFHHKNFFITHLRRDVTRVCFADAPTANRREGGGGGSRGVLAEF